jgi:hypothetical protein
MFEPISTVERVEIAVFLRLTRRFAMIIML